MITFGAVKSGDGTFAQRIKKINTVRTSGADLRVIEVGFDKISDWVRRDARVRTGYMRNSVKTFGNGNTVSISVDAYYSRFIEFGTEHHRAFPFFFVNVHMGVGQIMNDVRTLYMK